VHAHSENHLLLMKNRTLIDKRCSQSFAVETPETLCIEMKIVNSNVVNGKGKQMCLHVNESKNETIGGGHFLPKVFRKLLHDV